MGDIFQKASADLAIAGSEAVKGVAWVSHLYTRMESKLDGFLKEEPQVVNAVTDLVEKGEVFLAATVPAISDKGLDLPADSAAFAALGAFIKSFEAAAATLKQIVAEAK